MVCVECLCVPMWCVGKLAVVCHLGHFIVYMCMRTCVHVCTHTCGGCARVCSVMYSRCGQLLCGQVVCTYITVHRNQD